MLRQSFRVTSDSESLKNESRGDLESRKSQGLLSFQWAKKGEKWWNLTCGNPGLGWTLRDMCRASDANGGRKKWNGGPCNKDQANQENGWEMQK